MTFPYGRPYNICPAYGVDNTPDPLNWDNITWNTITGDIQSKQITGITSGIYIQIQPGTGSDPTLYYRIDNSQITGTQNNNPPSSPWASITSDTTVIVSGNQWLSFTCHSSFGNNTRTAKIINKSDGNNTELDMFNYIATTDV